ncbi:MULTISPECIES: hypothetical protein [Bacillus]|uniref:hypothetical protein n=1 Tax=Bacillus TaxID=1386 RepID=UPI00077A8B40|nr:MULTISPECIES: hypothetical protein [Bacillus cereus group]KXY81861.1 hypothetical protein AT270_30745 [Bacillus cereus]MBG9939554.1 hypothetical protein [Bacillus tropicus]MED2997341.1 hypothetical protein [Bacillus tropicus]OTY49627.1 hypothetical protein BK748_26965 [Bacillus thuringiensis serovar graciosensis]
MHFKFKKQNETFIFTDICPELLKLNGLKRDDLIGKTIDTASHIGNKVKRDKLKQLYALAWNQQRVLFYYFPDKNPDIFNIVYLEPHNYYNQVKEVIGRCVPVYKKELQYPLQHADQYLSF